MPSVPARWITGTVGIVLLGCVHAYLPASPPAETQQQQPSATSEVQNAKLHRSWYAPWEPQEGRSYPVAVVLASEGFPAGPKDFWLRTLWQQGYCSLVLQAGEDRWSAFGAADVWAQLDAMPGKVQGDPDRVLLIADSHSGPLAMALTEAFPQRIVGLVLVSVPPVEVTREGLGLWVPRKEACSVPIWSVVGTRPQDAGKVLRMWRRLAASAPQRPMLTIDARLGRGMGPILPDPTIAAWMRSIAEGNTPKAGPDQQAREAEREFAPMAKEIRKAFEDPSTQNCAERLRKEEGPIRLSLQPPAGWHRSTSGEKPYPDKAALRDSNEPAFVQVYVRSRRAKPFFARVLGSLWEGTGGELLDVYNRRLQRDDNLVVPLDEWTRDGWTYQVSVVLRLGESQWHRWVILSAARDGDGQNPAAPLVLVMHDADQPDPRAMVQASRCLTGSVQVEATGPVAKTDPLTGLPLDPSER